MAFIGQALGSGGQSDWTTPAGQGLVNPVTQQQTDQALAQQQAFLQALQGQGGIQNQNAAFQSFQNLAAGTGPNPAQAQLAQATQANVANQASLAAGQRGASQNVGMISRGAANQGANIQQQAAGQAASMGAQQQLQGMQGMANIAGQQVGNLGNAANAYAANTLGGVSAYNNAQAGLFGSQNKANADIAIQNNKAQQGIFGGLLGGAGSILSDERLKKDIKPADDKIQDFLRKAGAHEYEYKDGAKDLPGAGGGKHTGPMAQELEKSEIGKQMVVNTPEGKGIDFGKSMATLLSAIASVNKRIDSMDGGKKKMSTGGEVEKEYETFPAPSQKMADGGIADPSAPTVAAPAPGVNKFMVGMQNSVGQMGGPQQDNSNPINSGMKELTQQAGSPLKPYIDNAKQSIMDYFTGAPAAPTATDPFGAPIPAEAGTEAAMEGQTIADAGMAAEGTEGAMAATEGASAAEGAAGAAGAAEAAEGAEGLGSAVALLASRGAHPKKKVPALVSPGEAYIPPSKVADVVKGKKSVREAGEVIKGKAKVKGDSEKNDTVKKTLDAGGVVVPRTKMKDDDTAAKFVAAIMAKSPSRGMKR